MKKLLVIVDMQNDFITGSLANKDAEAIIPAMCNLIKKWDGDIVCTLDTHQENYLETEEGKNLPVKHCIKQTAGWLLNSEIHASLFNKKFDYLEKENFGSDMLGSKYTGYDEVVFVGTCTDICVISNVLAYKAKNPETLIAVFADLCAGLTREKHNAALEVMRSCQVNIMCYQHD